MKFSTEIIADSMQFIGCWLNLRERLPQWAPPQDSLEKWMIILAQQIGSVLAFCVLLFGPIAFAWASKPAEGTLVVVAASIALVFANLRRFTSFSGAGFAAQLAANDIVQIKAVVENSIETPESAADDDESTSPLAAAMERDTNAVLDALDHPEYTWRYLKGIKADLDECTNPQVISQALKWLVENGFARRSQGPAGPIWSLTSQGRQYRLHRAVEGFEDVSE